MKKALSLLLCAAMLFGIPAVTASAATDSKITLNQSFINDKTFVIGDADSSGSFNAKDSYLLKKHLVDADEEGELNVDASDIDGNGEITAKDNFYFKSALCGAVPLSNYENGKQVFKFRICGVNVSKFDIVLPEGTDNTDNIFFAYELLSKYVNQATGVSIPMVFGTSGKANAIYFHDVPRDSEKGLELGDEGYTYEACGGNLHIYGTMRGNAYAVLEILEQYLGFRFMSATHTFSYKKRNVDIKEGTSVTYVPSIRYRHCGQSFLEQNGIYPTNSRTHFYLARKLNATENVNEEKKYGYARQAEGAPAMSYYGYFTGPVFFNAHSFYYQMTMSYGTMGTTGTLADKYYAKYTSGYSATGGQFGIGNWQPCLTDSDTYNRLYAGLCDSFNMIKERGYEAKYAEGVNQFSFSVDDNRNYCTCAQCYNVAVTQGEGYIGALLKMVNRAADSIQSVQKGLKLYTILYYEPMKTIPKTVRPSKNVIIMYCGNGCNNHYLGSRSCGNGFNVSVGGSTLHVGNNNEELILPQWAKFCRDAGTELWFWYYPVSYNFHLAETPNITNIYYDFKWLHEQGVTGIFYEGYGGNDQYISNCFESTKAYMASQMEWNPDMSYEEFTAILKEYLYMYFGAGYEDVYKYMLSYEAAGDARGCWQCCFDRPWNYLDKTYVANHYSEMRGYLMSALSGIKSGESMTETYKTRVNTLLASCELIGLSACRNTMYYSDNATYRQRCEWLYSFCRDNGIRIFLSNGMTVPASINYNITPIEDFYPGCSVWADH